MRRCVVWLMAVFPRLNVVYPTTNYTKPSAQILRTALRMSSSCSAPMIRSWTTWPSCGNWAAKCPWRSWGTWALTLGEDHDGLNLSRELGLTERSIKVFEGIHRSEEQVATGQEIMRTLACSEEVLEEDRMSLSRQTSVLGFFKSASGTRTLPPVLLDTTDNTVDLRTVRNQVSFP